MAKYTCDLEVVGGRIVVTTTPTPTSTYFLKFGDDVTFKSEVPNMGIEYTETTPFGDQAPVKTPIAITRGGVNFVVKSRVRAENPFRCGEVVAESGKKTLKQTWDGPGDRSGTDNP